MDAPNNSLSSPNFAVHGLFWRKQILLGENRRGSTIKYKIYAMRRRRISWRRTRKKIVGKMERDEFQDIHLPYFHQTMQECSQKNYQVWCLNLENRNSTNNYTQPRNAVLGKEMHQQNRTQKNALLVQFLLQVVSQSIYDHDPV